MSLVPFTEQTQLRAHQVAFGAGRMVSPRLTLRKGGPVVRKNGSQTSPPQPYPQLCY